jgi:hypothetical protein
MAVKMSMFAFWTVMPCGLKRLKMETVCSSEILVPTYKSIWHYTLNNSHDIIKHTVFYVLSLLEGNEIRKEIVKLGWKIFLPECLGICLTILMHALLFINNC